MAKAKTQEEREAERRRVLDALKPHTHTVDATTTVTLKKELKGRIRSMMWRCKCGAKYDGEYWYKKEEN